MVPKSGRRFSEKIMLQHSNPVPGTFAGFGRYGMWSQPCNEVY
jgi:hypothetical protein